MAMCRLENNQQQAFALEPEIFQGIQLGYFFSNGLEGYCIVISGILAIIIEPNVYSEMEQFAAATWRPSQPVRGYTLEARYQLWWENLPGVDSITPINATRAFMYSVLTGPNPPPPSSRPNLSPGAPHGRGHLPPVAAHLPFHSIHPASTAG